MIHTNSVCFRFPPEIREALEAIKLRDGVPISEQVRRGVLLWLASKQVPVSAAKKGRRG